MSAPPDLTAADRWLAARSARDRKRSGAWPTPWWVCDAVARRLAPELHGQVVVDPACGDGRWLIAVARYAPSARLIGLDLDPLAVDAARTTLAAAGVPAELSCADALAPGAVPAGDWIVGNPPFVRPQHLDRARATDLWARFALATDKVDLAACFVERALERAPRLALVLPESLLSLGSWGATRARLARAGVDAVLELPSDTFGATVRSVVVITGPADRRAVGALGPDGIAIEARLGMGADAWTTREAPELAGAPLGDHVRFHMGVVCGDYARYVHPGRRTDEDRLTCRGRDVGRFTITDRDEYLWYRPDDMLARKPYVAPKRAELFDVPVKVVIAGTSGVELRAAIDTRRRFPLDSCYVAAPRHPDIDPYAVLGLLCARVVGEWYGARFRAPRVKGVELAKIPAPDGPWDEIAAAAREQDSAAIDAAVDRAYARTVSRS